MTDTAADERRALLHSALRAIDDLQAQLAERDRAAREPIAVVGMSCRFPGGATSPEAYWQLLRDGRDVVAPFPARRRELLAAAGIDLDRFGDSDRWYGGFLDDIEEFDPQFFGISPREAVTMDPQQRLALEVSWEALERAGIAPDSLLGAPVGVFLGITGSDYGQLGRLAGPGKLDVYSATGGALNAAAGRIAYTLGLQGPCMAIDTACSSSLVALHQACRSLRSGESELAIAGGVNLLLLPEAFECFERWGMMASDGRCKTFDASADGFVRGEGCGILVLKRLRDATAAGDPILAVIRGSAVNQDGRSSGLTAPNGLAQQAVIRTALADAGVDGADIQYFEAHGTGTTLGDPIEVEAIGAVLGQGRGERELLLGSVKTNIGHLESAAGIAGVIKVILAMEHGEVPASLHFHRPSERIPWPAFPVVVPTATTRWQTERDRRLAGVSGFGFSGTNAHLVLESAPPVAPPAVDPDERPGRAVVLGARSRRALGRAAGRLARWLDDHPDTPLADVATTLVAGRAAAPHRAGIAALDVAELIDRLGAVERGTDATDGATSGPAVGTATAARSLAFVFTGQGAQYAGMARELYDTEPVVRDVVDRCRAVVDPLLPQPLLDTVFAPDGTEAAARLDRTSCTQPALVVVELAVAELWRSWGVVPSAVLGHSVGEIAAAAFAGVLPLEDALRLVVARGALMGALPDGGAMTAVFAPLDEVAPLVATRPATAIAAINGPAHVVISGSSADVADIAAVLAGRGVATQELRVSHAFHSPLMDPMLDDFRRVAASVSYRAPSIPLVSNVSGRFATEELTTPDYWVEHVRSPVRFADGLVALREAGHDTVVEVGPHPVLVAMGRSSGLLGGAVTVGSLRRGRSDVQQVLGAAAALGAAGVAIDWPAVRPAGRRITLPPTPFDGQRCWLDPVPARSVPVGGHPLLGLAVPAPTLGAEIHHAEIGVSSPAWLGDHRLAGVAVFPGTGYLEAALAMAEPGEVVEELSIAAPLVLPEDATVALQTVVVRSGDARGVQVLSVTQGDEPIGGSAVRHAVHASARLSHSSGGIALPAPIDPELAAAALGDDVDVAGYYERLTSVGLDYGPAFRGLDRLVRGHRTALGRVHLPDAATAGGAARAYRVHPALLDAAFHVLGAAIGDEAGEATDRGTDGAMYVPVAMRGVRVFQPGAAAAWCTATLLDHGDEPRSYRGAITLHDLAGVPIAAIEQLEVRRTERSVWANAARPAGGSLVHELVWRARPAAAVTGATRRWLVLGDPAGLGTGVSAELVATGATCTLVAGDWTGPVAAHLDVAGDAPLGVVDLRAVGLPPRAERDVHAPGATTPDELLAAAQTAVGGTLEVVQALASAPPGAVRLVVVTRGAQSVHGERPSPAAAAAWGLARVVATEAAHLGCTCIDLDPAVEPSAAALAGELVHGDEEDAVALRDRERWVARLVPSRPIARPASPTRLVLGQRGSFDAIGRGPLDRRAPGPGEVEIEVRASGLNLRDVLNVLGMYPGDPGDPGLECAGVVTALGEGVDDLAVGDAVLGIAPHAFDSHVVTRADLVVPAPAGVSFAQGATVPIAFATAAHGLDSLAGLRRGERVLVHAGAGGVGMAAVQLALRRGAEVYATVGSAAKRAVLERLGVTHLYHSRSLDFADEILRDTGGEGVHVVLNSLADDFVTRSFDVLAHGGRFLEIGKRGLWPAERVAAYRPDVAYLPYDLAELLDAPGRLQALLRDAVDAIGSGALTPLPVRAFPVEQAVEAFRFMAQARHIGKVVLTHPRSGPAIRPDGAYLVTGGLGGVGLHVADLLAGAGARRVVLCGRSDPSEAAAARLEALRATAEVLVVRADVGDPSGVAEAVAAATAGGVPLRGVFHAAGVVDDGVLALQRWERVAAVLRPKLVGAALLDRATRGLDLDHFVLFSSASAVLGSQGQASYAAANRALDALAAERRSLGLPALSIGWGQWDGVGMAAGLDARVRDRFARLGVRPIPAAAAVALLDRLLDDPRPGVLAVDVDWTAMLASGPTVPPLLSELSRPVAPVAAAVPAQLVDALTAAPLADRRALLHRAVVAEVVTVLGLGSADLDERIGLSDLGMDSLMAVELANRLSALLGRAVASTAPFEHPTLPDLVAHAAELLEGTVELGAAAPARSGGPGGEPSVAATLPTALDLADVEDALLRELDDAGY